MPMLLPAAACGCSGSHRRPAPCNSVDPRSRAPVALRRRFLHAGVDAGILVLPTPAPAPGAAAGMASPAVGSEELLHTPGGNGVHAVRFK